MSQTVQIPKPKIDPNAMQDLEKMLNSGYVPDNLTYAPDHDKIFHGLPYEFKETDWLVDVKAAFDAKMLGASGKTDEAEKLEIFSDTFKTYYDTYQRVKREMDGTYLPYWSVVGAAGGDVATHYEQVRRIGDLLPMVTGTKYVMKNYQAINIAETVNSSRYNIEYPRKTSGLIKAQVEIADDTVPDNVREKFAIGTASIRPDGLQFGVAMRDQVESKINIMSEFMKMLPGVFMEAKNTKVLKIVNNDIAAAQTHDIDDWTAVAAGSDYYTNKAAESISDAESAVESYGNNLVMLCHDNVVNLYRDNTDTKNDGGTTAGNVGTTDAAQKTGTLGYNRSVMYYMDKGVTNNTFILCAKDAFLTKLQGPTIQTTVRRQDTAGQMECRFWFDFNKYVVTEPNAVYRGTSVNS